MGVFFPAFRIGLRRVDDGTTLAIDTHCFGKDTWTFTEASVEGVELAHEVAFHGSCPLLVGRKLHLNGLDSLPVDTVLIDTQGDAFGIVWGEDCKLSGLGGITYLLKGNGGICQ